MELVAIPDWDSRIERERLKQAVKEAPSEVGPGQGKRTDLNEPSVINTKLQRGSTNATYLTSRLKRDAPAIAARLERGEFRSVRAAAIEAGIVRVHAPLEKAKRLFLSLSDFERNEFLSWVYGEWR